MCLLMGLISACFGPVTSTKKIMDAETAVERSRVADAHERAPYEYYMAEELLHKAKEEWGYSDFQAADRYAEEARRQAERSLTKAKEDPFTGSPVSSDKLYKARLGVESPSTRTQSKPGEKDDPADILEDVNQMNEDEDE
jgi:vacuolar-type H+-ATPase subunit H